MKLFRLLGVTVLSVALLMSATACTSASSLTDLVKNLSDGKTAKTGEDYIEYTNSKRMEVVEPFVGDMLDSDTAEPLLDKIEMSYEEVEGKENTYTVYIDNSDGEYFYDGIFTLKSEDQTYTVNVDMLAPETYDFFELEIEGDPEDYLYYVNGDLYDWSNETLEADSLNDQYTLNDEGTKILVVVDENEITDDILKNFAEVFYKADTVYNLNEAVTYYFVTSDNYNDTDYSNYEYEMLVDTANQKAVIKDADGKEVFTEEY